MLQGFYPLLMSKRKYTVLYKKEEKSVLFLNTSMFTNNVEKKANSTLVVQQQ